MQCDSVSATPPRPLAAPHARPRAGEGGALSSSNSVLPGQGAARHLRPRPAGWVCVLRAGGQRSGETELGSRFPWALRPRGGAVLN